MKVGIEAIAFYSPEHYIELADLAEARGVDPDKYIKGLGQVRMAVATPMEDTVTLAVNAALRALENFGIDYSDIGTLVVGTESGVDHSKPVAVYVHEALGLRSNCHTYETKHACFGAMAAVFSANDWISCGRADGSKALIIASDIARYPIGDPGEPTQGAGAVAMVISDRPNLLQFDSEISGHYTKQVMDFWRPLYSPTAFVDGHYSIACYLEALEGALADALDKATIPELYKMDRLQACIYHVPFAKMAAKAHHRHFEIDAGERIDKESARFAEVQKSFAEKTGPWLSLNAVVGNIYTGSVFLSLIDLLRNNTSTDLQQISMFSYGSGCAASMNVAYPTVGFERFRNKIDPEPELSRRRRLRIEEYEQIMRLHDSLATGNTEELHADDWDLTADFLYLGNRDHIRRYTGLFCGAGGTVPGGRLTVSARER
ncbi:MAG TPA: hydroxymethylglutaryl-CoA synthase family protein [Sedimentisphaerales bacterium]|nr:hydroxymethylglutaryl-CoA synthase family protein [Sedimentisphaerales bacterium]HRS12410.1 hydroxymethylglutaryl-CoA synthase family protein [Sedimentisphaerales bacterium]HRV48948.1 hydroxymethylglutaryl-CoA synthase family protein [Sedimentisphaerales bacterium]